MRHALAILALLLPVLAPDAQAQQTKARPAPRTDIRVDVIARGLDHPWALQFLPSGGMLVTERSGRLRIVTAKGDLSPPVAGVPRVAAVGQGGLLDLALAPDFATSQRIVFTYAEPRESGSNGTAVATARLIEGNAGAPARLEDVAVIFRQQPAHTGGLHFGSRVAFAPDGRLFITLGERFVRDAAQDLQRHFGKVVRLNIDGSVPADNPFVGRADAKSEIWSYGHRNAQSAAIHPTTGKLWTVEHGPRGGDEINVTEKGRNYGWPVIGYGIDYSGARLHADTRKNGMEQPAYYWTPSIAPSGMAFYTGTLIPQWTGNLFVGALAGTALHRLVLDGEMIVAEEVLLKDRGWRIRDVRQGPDGALWLLTDDTEGLIVRLSVP